MNKFLRNYSLTVTGDQFKEPLIISLPTTIEFDITRNTLTSANVAQIRLYNLGPTNQGLLRKNVIGANFFPMINLVLRAGYGSDTPNLPIIFSGNVSQGWSVREGVNFISQMECYDGGFAFVNGQSNFTVPQGTPFTSIIKTLIQNLAPQVQLGSIGSYPGVTAKDTTYSGDTINLLNELTGGGFFIDNGIGYALGSSEYSLNSGPVGLVNYQSGLLNTPVIEKNGIVRFDMILEPTLNVGSGIFLDSVTNESLNSVNSNGVNGIYKITSIKHHGMVSPTVCGTAITTGEFFFLQNPTAVAGAA